MKRGMIALAMTVGVVTGGISGTREAAAAYRIVSASACDDYHYGAPSSAWFYAGQWYTASFSGWVYCPMPFDDQIQPGNVTTTYVFVYDSSPIVEATARSCVNDAYGLTVSCGTPSGSGTTYVGVAYMTPGPVPAPFHSWGSYYLEVSMPKDSSGRGQSLNSFYVYQP